MVRRTISAHVEKSWKCAYGVYIFTLISAIYGFVQIGWVVFELLGLYQQTDRQTDRQTDKQTDKQELNFIYIDDRIEKKIDTNLDENYQIEFNSVIGGIFSNFCSVYIGC